MLSGALAWILSAAIRIVSGLAIYLLEYWFRNGYKNIHVAILWVLFIPLTLLRVLLLRFLIFSQLEVATRLLIIILHLTELPFLVYTVRMTIPKGKKIVPIALSLLLIAANLYVAYMYHSLALWMIIRSVGLGAFIYYHAHIPTETLYNPDKEIP